MLETERLRLRPFAPGDAARVRELAGAAEVAATTLNIPHPYPEGAAEAWTATHGEAAARGESLTWAIVRRADDLLLGAISLRLTPAHERGELGYWLGVPYWNQGYTTEAARRVVAYGFAALGLHRIEARCLPRNVGSSRVMEKAGMALEGVLRGYAVKRGAHEDIAVYAILRPELGG